MLNYNLWQMKNPLYLHFEKVNGVCVHVWWYCLWKQSGWLCWVICSFTARSTYAIAVFSIVILSNHLSVHPSHMCFVTKQKNTAEILASHERVINLVFWYQKRLMGNVPFHLKFALKVTHPLEKRRLWPISSYNVSTVRASEKCLIIANRKSTTRFPTSYRRSAYVTPNSPKGWRKKRICCFCE